MARTLNSSPNLVMARMVGGFKQSIRESLAEFSNTPLKLKSDIGEQLRAVLKDQPTREDFEKLLDAVKSIRPATLNVSNGADKLAVDGMYGEDVLDGLVNVTENVKKVPEAIQASTSQLMKSLANIKLEIPAVQKVSGGVDITNKPEVLVPQLREVVGQLANIKSELKSLVPKDLVFPKSFKIDNVGDLQNLVNVSSKENADRIAEMVDKISQALTKLPKVEFPDAISVNNFPPQKYPQPVTHMSINSLNGFIKTTAVTVGTGLTKLPDYGELSSRRSLQIYNNSSTVTVFIGGSDVTATNGLPVPTTSYSPVIDAGPKTILYGVTSSSTANVRVIEVSDEASGR